MFNGKEWIPRPPYPQYLGDKYPGGVCVVSLSPTQSMLVGGQPTYNDAWIFDWNAKEWTETAPLNEGRSFAGCVSLGDQGVLVVGGFNQGNGGHIWAVELYDPVKGTWLRQPDLPRNINPFAPIVFNYNSQLYALFAGEDCIYKRNDQNGEWSMLVGAKLPELFEGYKNDKAIMVPHDFVPSCI